MKVVLFSLVVAVCCLTSCKTYMDYSSYPKMDDLKLGVNKEYVIEKWGQPFSFSSYVINNDTIVTLNYKTPKAVANCEFIVTSELTFKNDKLEMISQSDFVVPDNVILYDPSKTACKKQ